MTSKVLAKIAEAIASAPTSRRKVLALILQDPQRVLDESFEQLAQRASTQPELAPLIAFLSDTSPRRERVGIVR